MIRPARPDDAPRVAEVLRDSITRLCRADQHDDPDRLSRWLANKTPEGVAALIDRGGVFVAGDPIMAVGAIETEGLEPDIGRIDLLYIDPQARGQGWSTALLAHMEGVLATMGRKRCVINATATAEAFYESRGWQPDGPKYEGRWIVAQPMTKRLAAP